jgi:hypothetical protein
LLIADVEVALFRVRLLALECRADVLQGRHFLLVRQLHQGLLKLESLSLLIHLVQLIQILIAL